MKQFFALILLVTISFIGITKGQGNKQGFPEGKSEVYFFFRIASRTEIEKVTRQISIDNVRNDTVWAYANLEEFLKFSKNGYEITLLPSPGDAPGVVMSNNIQLSVLTTWNFYPTYEAYEDLMAQFQSAYPNLCQVTTIATLASGRKILVAKISDNVATDESEPEFLYTSSIHGDETTGYILMLHLIDYLLSNYGTDTEVTDLVNNLEIYINPLANPDGTYHGGNSSVSGATRYNANSIDLNRNYPDFLTGQHPDGNAWQPETIAFMDFATQHHFVASCNFHGGAEVVNYPWDTWYTLHADDSWWQFVSREYADTVHIHAPSSYMSSSSNGWVNGITNGAVWYIVHGGRQDYMNYYHHCKEYTIELSNTKLLPTSQLLNHWNYNWRSLILYMKEARYGIHGIITNSCTGAPVAAKVFINGHDSYGSECYSSSNLGDYHRLIKGGIYTLEISAPGFQTLTLPNVVSTDHNTVNLDIQLVPTSIITTAAVSAITGTSAVSGGNVLCDGGSSITARGVCWATTSNPTLLNSHTSDGTGTGAYTSLITGLLANTLYHVRAYTINTSGTVYGEDLTFTTSCGTVSTFPWTEGFENAGNIPGCWTQEQVAGSGIDWTYITGSGNSHPSAAHGGNYNACLKDNTTADNKTILISPSINLNAILSPTLTFWHTQAIWSGDQDQLIVYYKTSSSGSWIPLATYTASITAWTQETLNLPNSSSDYYIAFEGNAKYGYGVCLDDISITGISNKTLNLKVYIEGLFNGNGMNKAQNTTGSQFAGNVADQITVELHNSTSPYALAGGPYTLSLSTDGTASATIPGNLSSSYYIAIKHRNSIETWSATPVSFSGSVISFDFSMSASQAFGNNLKQISGKYVILSGDINQDGVVGVSDLSDVQAAADSFTNGYVATDVNGDGVVDSSDLIITDNNAALFVGKITP